MRPLVLPPLASFWGVLVYGQMTLIAAIVFVMEVRGADLRGLQLAISNLFWLGVFFLLSQPPKASS